MTMEGALWGGRFERQSDAVFFRFNRSFGLDQRLLAADIKASQVHCRALKRAGVISTKEADLIVAGLQSVLEESDSAQLAASQVEDVHTFIESGLRDRLGDLALKLHTGRSRNDQAVTAFRMWLHEETQGIRTLLGRLQEALLKAAERHPRAVLPGYTHLQRAQPIMWAHWCLSHFEALMRDDRRFSFVLGSVDVLPLGSAALAGTSFAIDRGWVASELGFSEISRNSLDAVGDRDFAVDFVSAASVLMMHLSRMAEDLIIYASGEFGFVELSDAIASGSSLMPQKKNPDALELIRGKSGRVFGQMMGILTMLKGLPTSYNKDLQEDKAFVFDTVDTVVGCLQVAETVLEHLDLHEAHALEASQHGWMNATELADYLVRKGEPFRRAHELVGRMVLHACHESIELEQLTLEEMQSFSPLIGDDVYHALSLQATLASKSQTGGTAPQRVSEALRQAREILATQTDSSAKWSDSSLQRRSSRPFRDG